MKKKLTPLEWEIMGHIWDKGENVTVREIVDSYYADGSRAYTTIQTVMNNLVQKGYLKVKKIGLVNHYTPIRQREQLATSELQQLIDRVFNGSPVALFHSLFRTKKLSEEEIKELKKMLSDMEKGAHKK